MKDTTVLELKAQVNMIGLQYQNRLYKVAYDSTNQYNVELHRIGGEAKVIDRATFGVDLISRIVFKSVAVEPGTLSTSNPLFHMFLNLPLISVDQLIEREILLATDTSVMY